MEEDALSMPRVSEVTGRNGRTDGRIVKKATGVKKKNQWIQTGSAENHLCMHNMSNLQAVFEYIEIYFQAL